MWTQDLLRVNDTYICKLAREKIVYGRRKLEQQKKYPTPMKIEQTLMAYTLWLIIIIIIIIIIIVSSAYDCNITQGPRIE